MSKPTSEAQEASSGGSVAVPAAKESSHFARGMRETVETFAIAFALAFLFKTFEADAFVIPTGSMAPTLMGRHKDVVCPECGYHYTANCSDEADRVGHVRLTPTGEVDTRYQVVECTCPNCRYPMTVDPLDPELVGRDAHPSYSGDRIWVSKLPYEFSEPERWDVIVFHCPIEAESYFIKRLVGLPNETLQIYHGDIYAKGPRDEGFVVQRKPPDKIRAMAQVVYDNDFPSPHLAEVGWPERWQNSGPSNEPGAWHASDDDRSYSTDGSSPGDTWIRYRHLVPSESFWRNFEDGAGPPYGRPRPQLITDFYAFNTDVTRHSEAYGLEPSSLGLHWVGDLIVECEADVRSSQGTLLFDLVKGGRHFRASIDVASGRAELSIDGLDDWRRTAETSVRGPGEYRLMLANVDRQLVLWVDGKPVTFNEPTTYEYLENSRPQANRKDPGDLAPVGIGSRGASVEVRHLRVLRDIYYIADGSPARGAPITDFSARSSMVPLFRTGDLIDFLSTPSRWQDRPGHSVFDDRKAMSYPLGPNQYFVLGDNSPASADARFWSGEHYVDRSLLVGKAMVVFWPHPLELPIPWTNRSIPVIPNLPEMEFIR